MKAEVPGFHYHDPRSHGFEGDPAAYTAWDLDAIRRSDLVFAYLERDNPSGFGLAVEIGYAAAQGKQVVLVDEKSGVGEDTARHLSMVRHAASRCFDTLAEGLRYLEALSRN